MSSYTTLATGTNTMSGGTQKRWKRRRKRMHDNNYVGLTSPGGIRRTSRRPLGLSPALPNKPDKAPKTA